ncbi:MAG: PIN domain-containing protein [Candidatus Hodarchaeota archaeon]
MVYLCLLDTNFLFVPLQFGIDIYEEIPRMVEEKSTLILLSGVEEELVEKIKRKKEKLVSKHGSAALHLVNDKVGRKIVEKMEIPRSPAVPVDDYIIHAAKSIRDAPEKHVDSPITGICIATNDKGLKKKVLKEGFKTIHVRQKSQLMME